MRSDDELVVVIPSGLLNPTRVSVFVRRKRHEAASDQHTPVERIQLMAGVDFTVECSAGQ